ncbi:hypothetical protein [Streptomyces chryseus]|uniref:Uncharacterized protein n=1 Tax=Streptomyces chryseus TaxID=68186 RepID=A0ABQ3EDT9_9ACTN|nr:hypothetical protein [Streptomyces chryseus]GHB29271.1 hypothetical protein GCM10010346_60940 [Streptomyces chryseus]
MERLTRKTGRSTVFHTAFYQESESKVRPLYRLLVKSFAAEVLGTGACCFQSAPTFRIHFPVNVAVGDFRTDG